MPYPKPRTLNRDTLQQLLEYDPSTGIFRWRLRPGKDGPTISFNKRFAGAVAGTVHPPNPDYNLPGGHRVIKIDGELCMAHHLAWFFGHNEFPQLSVHHINGNRDDNRISNLELRDHSQTLKRVYAKPRPTENVSGYTGVHPCGDTQRWYAMIKDPKTGKQVRIGTFDDAATAHAAYLKAAAKRWELTRNSRHE